MNKKINSRRKATRSIGTLVLDGLEASVQESLTD